MICTRGATMVEVRVTVSVTVRVRVRVVYAQMCVCVCVCVCVSVQSQCDNRLLLGWQNTRKRGGGPSVFLQMAKESDLAWFGGWLFAK